MGWSNTIVAAIDIQARDSASPAFERVASQARTTAAEIDRLNASMVAAPPSS